MKTLSVVLPCFNEEPNIAASVRDVESWMKKAGISGEIIVVNDGSRDKSEQVLKDLQKDIPSLKVVNHEVNQGYGVAVRSGCDAAVSEIIAFMDSDGQFHAEDIGLLLPAFDHYDMVTGRRRKRMDGFVRNTYGKVLGLFNWAVFGLWVRDVNCGLKAFKKSVWPSIRPVYGVEKLFNTELFLRLKRQRIAWETIPVPHFPRRAGTQTGGSPRVILRMMKEIINLKKSMRSVPSVPVTA